jgi:mannose-6-phosphate isomerase-like protein (cupin superfamily)
MNPQLTTLDPITSATNTKSILSKDGFGCSIITLAPGDETPLRESHNVEEHILFTIDGEATVRSGDLNTMLKKDEALLIPKGQPHLIAAGASGWAKVLRVDVPPRKVVMPEILTIDR